MLSARKIPSIEHLRQRDDARQLEARYGRDALVDALRAAARSAREAARATSHDAAPADADLAPECATFADVLVADVLVADAARRLDRTLSPSLRPVINATGVIVHTNLGRAPLADTAIARLAEVARGYSNLEYDIEAGGRGRRDMHAEALLCRLTGAGAAVVVNNNAAATMLLLAAIARGREVIISRGELVEIGGGFRVPEIMAQSGAVLREVGTTNRTRVSDYAAAIGERTALILRVHPSNFRIEGFTERPALADLAALGRRFGVPVAEDLGSGHVGGPSLTGTPGGPVEPTVRESLGAGLDLVSVSGDKLLGGPQAGIILGRAELVDALRRHPLMRAFRVDKLTYAALEATLVEHVAGRAATTVPVIRMLTTPVEEIEERARRLVARLARHDGVSADVVDGTSAVGGGSAPGAAVATRLVAVSVAGVGPDTIEQRLRSGTTPVVARIENGRLVLDLRTVLPWQDEALAEMVENALATDR